MSATQVQAEKAEKYLVQNQTAGYIGVIEINTRGEELGVNIEPYGTRWMTEEEMVATARAPRDPSDNPFEERVYMVDDPNGGARREVPVRPLILVPEGDAQRFVPTNERYVPTQAAPQAASPGVERQAPDAEAAVASPPSSTQAPASPPSPAVPQGPAPVLRTERAPASAPASQGLAGGQAPAGGQEAESWVQPPEAPGEVLTSTLGGSDEPAPEDGAEAAPDTTDHPGERRVPSVIGAQAAPQTPGQVDEEHAAAVDPEIGEETGAAKPPTQDAPEGEYARAEEVGSPDAPDSEGLVG